MTEHLHTWSKRLEKGEMSPDEFICAVQREEARCRLILTRVYKMIQGDVMDGIITKPEARKYFKIIENVLGWEKSEYEDDTKD
jgi:hypothetical protein